MITLAKSDTEKVELPVDMRWLDEFEWAQTAQATPERSITGALIIQQSPKVAGRNITLGGEWVWLTHKDLTTLRAWSDEPALVLTLSLHGEEHSVIFRIHEGALDVEPVDYEVQDDGTEQETAPYRATIKLMTV